MLENSPLIQIIISSSFLILLSYGILEGEWFFNSLNHFCQHNKLLEAYICHVSFLGENINLSKHIDFIIVKAEHTAWHFVRL